VRSILPLIGLCVFTTIPLHADDAPAEPLRVMSFNIRYATAPDGENAWSRRSDLLVDTIRRFNPDLLGTQEVLASQADFLSEQFSDDKFVGVGRDDGKRHGEFSALLYRSSRFELVDSGTFWLSEKPDRPGSKSWDSSLPRIATWVRLRDRANAGHEFCFLNTHWDHRGPKARLESAGIIRRWLAEHAAGVPIIVTGDLNAGEETDAYRVLASADGPPQLLDSYRTLHAEQKPDEATFHGFSGKRDGVRIDFILHTPDFKTKQAEIDRANQQGRYPSDHYPVTALLVPKSS
jgi:endonuclease/exonuclease/phosphatase family metal-dependent hydrolase